MLNAIIRFSIHNKFIIGLMTFMLIIWGVWSAKHLPIDAVPDITNNQVQIYTFCPSLASQEVEQLVTFPIEQSLANIPKITETRSISRFGLSVITVVFDEHVNIYFARQLINERLKDAVDQIPEGIGTPEMAPVSTGLGEVYQYIIHPEKGSERKYDAKALREMQDWIVARQLYGTPGVAEVNSFGGELKQYEVAVNTDRLQAMGVSIPDVFEALEKNNQNTGGAYIEKGPASYYIRGLGIVSGIEDVNNIAIKKSGISPVFIRDVAIVQYGHAIRYGALTYNGDVDAVGGVVMMLKGENSHEVVERIKEKLPTIQASLPDDVKIEAYLDRTNLVDRTIKTVIKNLTEGALIVIFVLVLFLGNFRAGAIVASIIPLAMLFAIGMMKVFNVSANLLSLGALDFGLIVDGTVIVVEATMHHLGFRNLTEKLSQNDMDEEVYESSSKIRKTAAFGEIIILIVYLPILTLAGIEGKMFKPMAQTVGFAILGALILSITYIPMMSALFLPKKWNHDASFSDRLMDKFQGIYLPLLKQALKVKYVVLGFVVTAFAISLLLFSRMGSEFIPQLQEGDYAFHCILPQGTSLTQSIETSMQASRIIKSFEEVKMVVGKTGSAEVPTDPMPPEVTDIMVVLKPEMEWTSGRSYSQLGDDIEEALGVLPGIFFEKSQPIQMRFNELMTGVRQDVAIKIFGENMDTLAHYGDKVNQVIQKIQGVGTPQVERVSGLPEINIEYDRRRIANYGLNIKDVNDIVSTAFAGKAAGKVYENERRFDLVVRLDSTQRGDIENIRNLLIPTPEYGQIPLSQLASVEYVLGPAQISRESGKRRIVVGFNLDNRDVQSVVENIKKELGSRVKLPTGYYFTYGGQFQNLQEASARLMIAVPVSLLLIFVLLFFTVHSVKQALLIFMAIPMSAIGGVMGLIVRGMPFSISAGIGFIALFGVAVLNGIVLIGTFNYLKKEGVADITQRVLDGATSRLRPVLMTATVASLGFLPMALSTSAGAEVQKPLATVVIGGLVTATLLTLFVLPMLYLIFDKDRRKFKSNNLVILALCFTLGLSFNISAQTPISLEAAIQRALANNRQLSINQSLVNSAGLTVKTATEIPKTGIFVENEDYQPSNALGVMKIGISQDIAWPGLYKARRHYFDSQLKYASLNGNVLQATIRRDVSSSYYTLRYLNEKQKLYFQLDSIYGLLYNAAKVKVKAGQSAMLEQITSASQYNQMKAFIQQNEQDINSEQLHLMLLMNTSDRIVPEARPIDKVPLLAQIDVDRHPEIALQQQQIEIAKSGIDVQKNMNKPEFSARVFSQRLWGASDPFTGFSVSAGIPIFGLKANSNKIKVAEIQQKIQEETLEYRIQVMDNEKSDAVVQLQKYLSLLNFYESSGLDQANQIIIAATLSYNSGDISYAELSQFVRQAVEIKQNYLDALQAYNQSAIQFNYFNQQ